jgi:hypothetical protein
MSPFWFPPITTAVDVVGVMRIVVLGVETVDCGFEEVVGCEFEEVVECEFEKVVSVVGTDLSTVEVDAGLKLSVTDDFNVISVVAPDPSVRVAPSTDTLDTERTSPTDAHSPSNLDTETSKPEAEAAVRA